jgi:hypothetical protein
MLVDGLERQTVGGRVRLSARVTWEDCDRAPQELWFETLPAFADALADDVQPFLIACSVPAYTFGERRLASPDPVCPDLKVGINRSLRLLAHWDGVGAHRLPRLEVSGTLAGGVPRGRAGVFYSGGIDSFAALLANRQAFSPDHPSAYRDGILVHGLEMDDEGLFEHVRESLDAAADEIGLTLLPVYTNIYLHYRDEDARQRFRFWRDKYEGAAFAAVAHALSGRLDRIGLASSDDYAHLAPAGSHVLLDPSFSSRRMTVTHENPEMSRLEKTRLVTGWAPALKHLRVCNDFRRYDAGRLNCGRCEKCTRTMLALLALGALGRTPAFVANDVEPERVRVGEVDDMVVSSYSELVPLLEQRGRQDLVRAIRRLEACHRSPWRRGMRSLRRRVRGALRPRPEMAVAAEPVAAAVGPAELDDRTTVG